MLPCMHAGGSATAEWLQSKLADIVSAEWDSSFRKQSAITEAYLAADRKLLKGSGFMGMGESAWACAWACGCDHHHHHHGKHCVHGHV